MWLKRQLTEANRQTGYLTAEFKKAREECHGICEHNRMLMQYISEASTALSAPPNEPHHLAAPLNQHETAVHALIHHNPMGPGAMPPGTMEHSVELSEALYRNSHDKFPSSCHMLVPPKPQQIQGDGGRPLL